MVSVGAEEKERGCVLIRTPGGDRYQTALASVPHLGASVLRLHRATAAHSYCYHSFLERRSFLQKSLPDLLLLTPQRSTSDWNESHLACAPVLGRLTLH